MPPCCTCQGLAAATTPSPIITPLASPELTTRRWCGRELTHADRSFAQRERAGPTTNTNSSRRTESKQLQETSSASVHSHTEPRRPRMLGVRLHLPLYHERCGLVLKISARSWGWLSQLPLLGSPLTFPLSPWGAVHHCRQAPSPQCAIVAVVAQRWPQQARRMTISTGAQHTSTG